MGKIAVASAASIAPPTLPEAGASSLVGLSVIPSGLSAGRARG